MIKKGYYYLFYRLYRFSEAAPSKWLSEWKASLSIDVLELFLMTSLVYYFDIPLGNGLLFYLIFALVISIPNYFIFNHNDKWKEIVAEFNKLPKKKNRLGGAIVWSIILAIIINLILSVVYMDQRARKNHKGPYSKEYLEQNKHR